MACIISCAAWTVPPERGTSPQGGGGLQSAWHVTIKKLAFQGGDPLRSARISILRSSPFLVGQSMRHAITITITITVLLSRAFSFALLSWSFRLYLF